MTTSRVIWDLAMGGVNHSIEGNGGSICTQFIPAWQRVLETVIFVPAAIYAITKLWPHLDNTFTTEPRNQSRYAILTTYSLIFGAEIAYKMISRTGIFLLNPCHITTVMQLLLLSMDAKDKRTNFLFRIMIYFTPGAVFALAFPILNTRLLPGEVLIYYVQHIAILAVPPYLLYQRGAFEAERADDFVWPAFGLMLSLIYHFVVLQFVGLWSGVNLNNMLCPGISDPFRSRFYRLCAIGHQFLLVPIISKTFSAIGAIAGSMYTQIMNPLALKAE